MANKITRHIPNSITCCNLISGCIATITAVYGDLWLALLFIGGRYCWGSTARWNP